MFLKKLFPYALAACFAVGLSASPIAGQTEEIRPRNVAQSHESLNLSPIDAEDPVIISLASAEDINRAKTFAAKPGLKPEFKQLINSAIEQRLGTRYVWGGTGPSGYDCSGFVWSTFKSAGVDFERASARTLWSRFDAPAPEEKFTFGTLVFFSNLTHIGIVADEHGFYHASRRHGVVYSPFSEYWLARIDGFRRVPLAPTSTAAD